MLIVMHSSGLVRLYSFQSITEQVMELSKDPFPQLLLPKDGGSNSRVRGPVSERQSLGQFTKLYWMTFFQFIKERPLVRCSNAGFGPVKVAGSYIKARGWQLRRKKRAMEKSGSSFHLKGSAWRLEMRLPQPLILPLVCLHTWSHATPFEVYGGGQ